MIVRNPDIRKPDKVPSHSQDTVYETLFLHRIMIVKHIANVSLVYH